MFVEKPKITPGEVVKRLLGARLPGLRKPVDLGVGVLTAPKMVVGGMLLVKLADGVLFRDAPKPLKDITAKFCDRWRGDIVEIELRV